MFLSSFYYLCKNVFVSYQIQEIFLRSKCCLLRSIIDDKKVARLALRIILQNVTNYV